MDRAYYPFQALMNNDTLRNVMCLKPSVKVTWALLLNTNDTITICSYEKESHVQ